MFRDQFNATSLMYAALSGGTGSPPTASTASGDCQVVLSNDATHGLASCSLLGTCSQAKGVLLVFGGKRSEGRALLAPACRRRLVVVGVEAHLPYDRFGMDGRAC